MALILCFLSMILLVLSIRMQKNVKLIWSFITVISGSEVDFEGSQMTASHLAVLSKFEWNFNSFFGYDC